MINDLEFATLLEQGKFQFKVCLNYLTHIPKCMLLFGGGDVILYSGYIWSQYIDGKVKI
jgi:hypothetical protein